MVTASNIIDELESRRNELGMSCHLLAKRCGLAMRTVQRVLHGEVDARLQTLLAIAGVLGADIGLAKRQSIHGMKDRQARAKARRLAAIAQGSSALEGQAVNKATVRKVERRIADGLRAGSNIRLWS